ncbi:APC family permease [Erythrobacter sp. NE805]|uniref:APC family permease n=1 Tax=Erythrobacter sp. NE805 TaxID=3389875 RepID=UPI00396B3D62
MPAIGASFFALLGFEAASMVTQRVRDPMRNVTRATHYGLAFVLLVYLLVTMGIVLAVPPSVLTRQGAPLAAFAAIYAGGWAASGIALFAAISAIGALNPGVLFFGEIPYGLVRDGQLPAWMAPEDERGIGRRALILGITLGAVLVIVSRFSLGEQVLDFLLRLSAATNIFFYAGICLAGLKARTKPMLCVIGIAFSAAVLYGTGTEAALLGLGLMVVGVAVHFALGGRTTPLGTVPAD